MTSDPRRKLGVAKNAEFRQAFQPYGVAINELVYAWNRLHHNLAILAAVPKASHLTETQRKDILWTLNRIDENLRHTRNDAIHAPLMFFLGTGAPGLPDRFASSVDYCKLVFGRGERIQRLTLEPDFLTSVPLQKT